MSVECDENEKTAEYYNGRVGIELKAAFGIVQELVHAVEDGKSMTYSQFLTFKRAFEAVEDAMHSRDKFGTHSKTGQARFRHIAHPERYPNPEAALV